MVDFTEPRSGLVDAGGMRLHYVARGDPANPAMVLVHGMRDQARSWDWIAEPLARRFHVVAPDLRGHGDSAHAGSTGYAMGAYVLDLANVIDALGLTSVALVGHSLGGAIAIRYAAAFSNRVRSLCAIEGIELPIVRDERAAPASYPLRLNRWIAMERERSTREPRRYATIAEAETRMAAEHPAFDAATIRHLVRHNIVGDAAIGWTWKYDNAARLRPPEDADGRDLDETLAAIACPTLLPYGGESWIPLPPVDRLALIRDHRVIMFPQASHWLHHQRRDDFLAALTAFLDTTNKGSDYA